MTHPIDWMVRNGVAPNLLLIFIIVAGLISAFALEQELFPEISLGRIEISVDYRGASPEEIEESILQRLEDQLSSIEGVDEITASASEGNGKVILELARGQPVSERLDEVKAEVDRITSFPELAEEPVVREVTNLSRIMEVAVYGDASEKVIKEAAHRIKNDLTEKSSMSYATVSGVRDYEISIEVSLAKLRAYGIALEDVARAVGANSLDLPGGDLDTDSEQLLLRAKGRNYAGVDFRNIIVFGSDGGAQVRLGEIAHVHDGFRDVDLITKFNGHPAAYVNVFRVGEERMLDITKDVRRYLATESSSVLPVGIHATLWRDESENVADRLNMLLRNGALGLTLVLICLALLLGLKLAFWVAVGIFWSFIATLVAMYVLGVSINVLSLFGFILAIGIVVDDAIVVGENVFAEVQRGRTPVDAAIAGSRRVATPVLFAVLTTIIAFVPILTMPTALGQLIAAIPVVVVAVLLFSLLESLLILPHHLSLMSRPPAGAGAERASFDRLHAAVDRRFQRFIDGPLDKALRFVTRHYLVTMVAALSLLILGAGLLAGGIVKFTFFPNIAGSNVRADIELHDGSTAAATDAVATHVYEAGIEVADLMQREYGLQESFVRGIAYSVGQISNDGGPAGVEAVSASHIGQVRFEMTDIEALPFHIEVFERRWRDNVGLLADVKRLSFAATAADFGPPVEVALSAPTPGALQLAVDRLRTELQGITGVFDVEDDRSTGKREVNFKLRPRARNFGLALDDLARQVRAAFFGAEALRVQRGREEVRVYVRLPESERNALTDLDDYRIRTPVGGFVPLQQVADLEFVNSPATIKRRNGRRVVTVTADVDVSQVTGEEVKAYLANQILPQLQSELGGLNYSFTGQGRDLETIGSHMVRSFGMALLAIYALLAIAFRSYFQPIVIMAAIPLGVIGALVGHLLLGLQLGMLSIFGLIALSGVIINNSLVMVDFINAEWRDGKPLRDAIIDGAKGRFRPVFLTAITTFLGVLPIVLEKSVQAQFVIPMAVSLGFGVLFGTAILMLLVPALVMMPLSHPKMFTHEAEAPYPRTRGSLGA